jgi:Uma2 family endonuclease
VPTDATGRRLDMTTATRVKSALLTAEDVMDRIGQGHWELVRGEVREMPPAGWEHGVRAMRLGARLALHVESQQLGIVLAAETGFLIARDPDTIRAPDAAFIPREKVPEQTPRGWVTVVPDLVIEVVSPSDTVGDVEEKIADWLKFGVRLVWAIYSGTRTVQVHRPAQPMRTLTEADPLDGEDVVPGFSLPVRELFA